MLDDPFPRELLNNDGQMTRFVADYAQGFLDYDEICERYGFVNRAVLFHFSRNNTALERLISQHRTAYESDDNVERRVRLKAGLAAERLIPAIAQIVMQPETPIGQKIDCFHKLLRAAGTDGPPPAPLRADQGGGGPSFTLNFIWSDGTKENVLTARPSPPIIEHEP